MTTSHIGTLGRMNHGKIYPVNVSSSKHDVSCLKIRNVPIHRSWYLTEQWNSSKYELNTELHIRTSQTSKLKFSNENETRHGKLANINKKTCFWISNITRLIKSLQMCHVLYLCSIFAVVYNTKYLSSNWCDKR